MCAGAELLAVVGKIVVGVEGVVSSLLAVPLGEL